MIDLDILRRNPERVRDELKKRFIRDLDLAALSALDDKRRTAITELENLRAEQKKLSKSISTEPAKKGALLEHARALATAIKKQEPGVEKIEREFMAAAARLPNFIHESVPIGPSAAESEVAAVVGEKPLFDFPVKRHDQLAEAWGALDTKRAARVSGSRFSYRMGDLALLEFALFRFTIDELLQRGFTPMLTPTLVQEEALYGAGTFPIDTKEVYAIPADKLYLIGTSEITLLNYHAHETLDLTDGPRKYTGFTTNYRREAGAYGKDIHGLIRQHQFDKLEMFAFVSQEQSWDFFENELVPIAEGLVRKLGLHYRKLVLSSGDLPRKFQKTYDLEVWLPSEQRYLETHSLSHAGDFQARRLGIKYVTGGGQRRFVHTLNATACAFSRMPAVILENYQRADGRVAIPEVLQPYLYNRQFLGKSA